MDWPAGSYSAGGFTFVPVPGNYGFYVQGYYRGVKSGNPGTHGGAGADWVAHGSPAFAPYPMPDQADDFYPGWPAPSSIAGDDDMTPAQAYSYVTDDQIAWARNGQLIVDYNWVNTFRWTVRSAYESGDYATVNALMADVVPVSRADAIAMSNQGATTVVAPPLPAPPPPPPPPPAPAPGAPVYGASPTPSPSPPPITPGGNGDWDGVDLSPDFDPLANTPDPVGTGIDKKWLYIGGFLAALMLLK